MPHPSHHPEPKPAGDPMVRAALKKVQTALDQDPEAFRPAGRSRLWRITVALLIAGCLAVWFLLPLVSHLDSP